MPVLQKCILMPLRLIKAAVTLFIAIFLFSSCAAEAPVKKSDYLLGTIVSITVYGCDNGDRVIDECFKMVREIENKVSPTIEGSFISELNNSALTGEIKTDSEVFGLIQESLYYCYETEGAFDIGLGKLIALWGIGTDRQAIPDMYKLKPYIDFKGYEHIILNYEQKSVCYDNKQVSINLGACAKGYAVNKAVAFLKEKGVKSAVIDFGGSIYAIGNKDGKGYDIGIADPRGEDVGGIISGLSDISIVTSGDYQRYFEQNGKRYHHIFDSKTAFPSESGVRSVTVVCSDAFKGDCLSTAAFVLGTEKGSELLDRMNCGYIFFTDDDIVVSDNLKDRFSLIYE